MDLASLFQLAGPDLVIILLIVLFLFGVKKLPPLARGMEEAIRQFREAHREWSERLGGGGEPEGRRGSPLVILNRLLVPLAIVIFLMACGVWLFGNSH